MKNSFAFLIVFGFCLCVVPAQAQTSAPAKVQSEQALEVSVTRGDTKTTIWIETSAKESRLKMKSSEGPKSDRVLKAEDADYFFEKYKSLSTVKIIPKECQRSFVQILYKSKGKVESKKVSCIGVKTITEPAYADYLRLLVAML